VNIWRDRNKHLSDFMKNIFICVPNMNKSLMVLVRVSKLIIDRIFYF